MPNYQYVTTAQYHPYTMQEMLTPFLMYKEAYEKDEQDYLDYIDKMDTFKYLEEVAKNNPNSKAAQIYKGYADEMNAQFDDFINNGLNPNNRRGLTRLKRRYKGEIGRLEEAKNTLDELTKEMRTKGSSYLWGTENPTLDTVLDNPNFVNYGISTEDLYKRGAQFAQSEASRLYSDTRVADLTRHYQEIIQEQGYSKDIIDAFRRDLNAIPEFKNAIDNILLDTGAGQNLSGYNLERARQSIISGLIDGAAFKRNSSIKDNPNSMTAYQALSLAMSAASSGMVRGKNGYYYDYTLDPKNADELWKYEIDPVTHEILGYSKKYEDAVSRGLIPGKKGDTTGTSNDSSNLPKKYDRIFNAKGEEIEPPKISVNTTAAVRTKGIPLTYEQAVELFPFLEKMDDYAKGQDDYIYYYKQGTGNNKGEIRPIHRRVADPTYVIGSRNKKKEKETPQQPKTEQSPANNEKDQNRLID